MMHLCKKLLEYAGLESDRLRIEWISAAEGTRFAKIMNDFAGKLRELGPVGNGNGTNAIQEKLEEVQQLVPYLKISKKDKLATRLDNEADYDDLYTIEEVEEIFSNVVSYYIDPEKCQACMICAKKCPVDGIAGGKNKIHVIDQDSCTRCGTCLQVCPQKFEAVVEVKGRKVPDPIPEEQRTVARKKAGKAS